MDVACPNCGAANQVAGKYCENCGFLIPADAGQSPSATGTSGPAVADLTSGATQTAQPAVTITSPTQLVPPPNIGDDTGSAGNGGATPTVGAQFAVVRDGQASLNEGFTLNKTGEFLVGRMDQETGHQVDVDLRQWVQPMEVGGQKQFLIHRKQCYIGLADGGVVTIRPWPGYEADTLVKGPGESTFTSLQNLGEKRAPRPDGSFELQLHDQIFMGDPEAVMYYLSGDPTAQDNYIVLELINKS